MSKSTSWGYDDQNGPDHWGDTYELCGCGEHQSPINITSTQHIHTEGLHLNYSGGRLGIHNDGHTVMVNCADVGTLTLDGDKFTLTQFHFHAPSEHTVNGQPADMELHLVHCCTHTGAIAVLGVLMMGGGTSNDAYTTVFEHLPQAIGGTPQTIELCIMDLLPENRTHYYRYDGSLTTPPCSEGVRWLVLADTITVSDAHIAAFRELYDGNVRPVQPLNDRTISENE
jgi:carbonic anhydrase